MTNTEFIFARLNAVPGLQVLAQAGLRSSLAAAEFRETVITPPRKIIPVRMVSTGFSLPVSVVDGQTSIAGFDRFCLVMNERICRAGEWLVRLWWRGKQKPRTPHPEHASRTGFIKVL